MKIGGQLDCGKKCIAELYIRACAALPITAQPRATFAGEYRSESTRERERDVTLKCLFHRDGTSGIMTTSGPMHTL